MPLPIGENIDSLDKIKNTQIEDAIKKRIKLIRFYW